MKNISVIILLLFSLFQKAAENPALEELKNISKAFSTKNVWASVEVNGFKKLEDSKSFFIGRGEFRILQGKGYYSSFDDEVYLSNTNTTLMIDNANKNIGVICKGLKDVKKLNPSTGAPDMKVFTKMADSISLEKNTTKGINKLTMLMRTKESQVVKTEIFYDAASFFINRIVYYFNPNKEEDYGAEKNEVTYHYKDAGELKEELFETDKFVKKTFSGKYEPKEAYKNYRVKLLGK